jgi:hypothetical protein
MNRHATQGALLADRLKRKPHTYLEMLRYGLSTSPWKRVLEWLDTHPGWRLEKGTKAHGCDELVTWRVVKA